MTFQTIKMKVASNANLQTCVSYYSIQCPSIVLSEVIRLTRWSLNKIICVPIFLVTQQHKVLLFVIDRFYKVRNKDAFVKRLC